MAVTFFNPSDSLNLDGWEVQSDNPTTTQQRSQALGSDGDEIASQTFDAKTSVSLNYVCTDDDAEIPFAGAIIGGYHVDNATVTWSATAFCTLAVTAHKHGTTAHPACRTYTGSKATVGTMFGCPSTIPGVTIPTGAGVRTVTYATAVNHVDELGNAGAFLAADNYDGTETVTVETVDSADLSPATGWDYTSRGRNRTNTAAETSSITVEHHIAHDTSAS